MFLRVYTFAFMAFFYGCVSIAIAEEVRVAVAANFLTTLNEIITNFQTDTGHTVVVSSGSSGKLYAQIQNGAPFELFFSADVKRPQLLEEEGLAVKGSRFVYSVGRLTLWSPDSNVVNGDGQAVLSKASFRAFGYCQSEDRALWHGRRTNTEEAGPLGIPQGPDGSRGKYRTNLSIRIFEECSARICGPFPSFGSKNQRERQPVGRAGLLS